MKKEKLIANQRNKLISKLGQISEKKLNACLIEYNNFSAKDKQKYFYKCSYNEIVKAFSETRTAKIGDWALRVGLIHSWLAKIPTPNFEQKLLDKAHHYENEIRIGLQKISNNDELEALVNTNHFKEYYYTINKIINNTDAHRLGTNLSSVSKMFHFIFPELFIIVDKKTRQNMIGRKTDSNSDYEDYRNCTKTLNEFINGPEGKMVKGMAHKNQITPIRLLDIYFFHQAK